MLTRRADAAPDGVETGYFVDQALLERYRASAARDLWQFCRLGLPVLGDRLERSLLGDARSERAG